MQPGRHDREVPLGPTTNFVLPWPIGRIARPKPGGTAIEGGVPVHVLGINCFSHDTAACLLGEGRIVAFAEEERFNRERHTKRFPDQAIGFCLQAAGIGMADVDVVAFATGQS